MQLRRGLPDWPRCSSPTCAEPVSHVGYCRQHATPRLEDAESDAAALWQGQDGTVVLAGHGAFVKVTDGHLVLGTRDGGNLGRYSRADRLQRVVVGTSGSVSLLALWWLQQLDATFTVIDLAGNVLTHTGPTPREDARLRRAQATLPWSPGALLVGQYLIDSKLSGYHEVLAKLEGTEPVRRAMSAVAAARERVSVARSAEDILHAERNAGLAYHNALADIPLRWHRADASKVPAHWRTWGPRRSALTNTNRRATNPTNALVNWLTGLAVCECTAALAACGLDSGMGFGLHSDVGWRRSGAWEVIEPVRPVIDALVLRLLHERVWRRADFAELAQGEVRLLPHKPLVRPDRTSAARTLVAELTRLLRVELRRTGIIAKTVEQVAELVAAHALEPPGSKKTSALSSVQPLSNRRKTAARHAEHGTDLDERAARRREADRRYRERKRTTANGGQD